MDAAGVWSWGLTTAGREGNCQKCKLNRISLNIRFKMFCMTRFPGCIWRTSVSCVSNVIFVGTSKKIYSKSILTICAPNVREKNEWTTLPCVILQQYKGSTIRWAKKMLTLEDSCNVFKYHRAFLYSLAADTSFPICALRQASQPPNDSIQIKED